MSIIDSPCFTFPHAFCLCVVLIWVFICPHLSTTTYKLQSIFICCQEQKLPRHSFSHLLLFPSGHLVHVVDPAGPGLLIVSHWCLLYKSIHSSGARQGCQIIRALFQSPLPAGAPEGGRRGREGGGTEKGGGEEREREGGREREEGEFIASNSRRIGDRNSYFSLFGEKCPSNVTCSWLPNQMISLILIYVDHLHFDTQMSWEI